jgi:hypothetical protein
MAASEMTISDLVDCAAPPNEATRLAWLRRARYYAQNGLLNTDGPLHAGRGRHRRFSEEAAYLAALLFRLGSAGLPLPVLDSVASAISTALRDPSSSPFKQAWEAAKGGHDVHIGLMFSDPEATPEGVPTLVQLHILGEKLDLAMSSPVPLHVVNLRPMFAPVRAGLLRATTSKPHRQVDGRVVVGLSEDT